MPPKARYKDNAFFVNIRYNGNFFSRMVANALF